MRTDREVFGEKTAPGDFLPVLYHELNINGEARGGGGNLEEMAYSTLIGI